MKQKTVKTATVKVSTISVFCPHCGEEVPEPASGSFLWDVTTLNPNELFECGYCEGHFKLPKQTESEAL